MTSIMLAAALLSLGSSVSPQEPPAAARADAAELFARRLAAATSLRRLDDVRRAIATSPDGKRLGAIARSGEIQLLSAGAEDAPRTIAAPADAHCLCLCDGDGPLWVGTGTGVVLRSDGNAAAEPIATVCEHGVDGLCWANGRVAWWSAGGRRGGVIDQDGKPVLLALDGLASSRNYGGRSMVQFAAGGTLAVTTLRGTDQDRVAWFAMGDKEAAGSTLCYLSQDTPGFACADTFAAVAVRIGTDTWHIDRIELPAGTRTPIDTHARGGHFVDLFLSPSGRWLVEGDFEEDGLVAYDLGASPPKASPVGQDEDVALLGFAADGSGAELLVTTARHHRGVSLWPLGTEVGKPVVLPAFAERRCDAAGTFANGRRLWLCCSDRDGESARWSLDVLAVPE